LLYLLPFPDQVLQTKIQPILAEDVAAIIAKLCTVPHPPRLVNSVGSAAISLQELILLAEPKTRILSIPKPVFDCIFRIISPLLSSLINPAQYQLITSDNTADSKENEYILGRQPHTTTDFWRNELNR
jgi:hypothetical protein